MLPGMQTSETGLKSSSQRHHELHNSGDKVELSVLVRQVDSDFSALPGMLLLTAGNAYRRAGQPQADLNAPHLARGAPRSWPAAQPACWRWWKSMYQ